MKDGDLIEGCIRQDKKSWDHFVERFSKLIYSTLYKVFREKGVVEQQNVIEELFNETFVMLMKDDAKKLRQFKGGCSLASWVRLITTNVVIDYLRKLRPVVPLDEESEEGSSLLETLLVDEKVRVELSRQDEKEIFGRIFGKLDSKDQLLLRLLFVDEVGADEAGQIIGLARDAIYMRKSRVTGQLKDLILEEISVRKS